MSKARDLADLAKNANDRLDDVATSTGALSNRNLIINGAMQVAQRGTSATGITTTGYYTVDRFEYHKSSALTGQVTLEQSTDAPDGFKNSAKITITSTDTLSSSEYVALPYYVEGYDLVPLGFGTSGAKPFTLSFWVKASVTGEYAIAFQNNVNTSNFMHTYTVDAANTWEYKTMTIPAETSGTWDYTNSFGLKVWISLGVGADYEENSTLSDWQSGLVLGSTNGVKLLENAGATWQITGVQLEVGDTATPFEHRSYGDELTRCQRYLYRLNGNSSDQTMIAAGFFYNTTGTRHIVNYPVTMRGIPSVSANDLGVVRDSSSDSAVTLGSTLDESIYSCGLNISDVTATTVGEGAIVRLSSSTSSYIEFDAEL